MFMKNKVILCLIYLQYIQLTILFYYFHNSLVSLRYIFLTNKNFCQQGSYFLRTPYIEWKIS